MTCQRFHTVSRMRENCTYGSMRGRAYPAGASRSTLHSTYKELTYGVDIYGQCNGGKIRDQKVTHSGSIAPGFTVSAALVESIIKLLPGNFQSSEIGLVVFTQLFWEEVPFSRKENKDGKDPYLEFEIMLQCVVTLYEKGDEETKKVPMPFTITLKKQLVHFNCEE